MTELFQWLLGLLKQFRIFVIVLPWESVIRCRLGSRVRVWDSGWHFRIPFVDSLSVVNTRLRICNAPMQTLTTADGQSLSVSFSFGFRITDPHAALMRFTEPETSLAGVAQSLVAQFIQDRPLSEIKPLELSAAMRAVVVGECGDCIEIDYARVVDFVAAPTMRLLQEQRRHMTTTTEREI